METAVSSLYKLGLAPSTQRVYASAQNRFLNFCSQYGYASLPLSEHTLCLFLASLQKEGIKHTTMKSYLSGLRHFQISSGLSDPHIHLWPKLEYVLKGVKRAQAMAPSSAKPRLPITPAILRKLREVWLSSPVSRDYCMLWVASLLGFYGFLRAGGVHHPIGQRF